MKTLNVESCSKCPFSRISGWTRVCDKIRNTVPDDFIHPDCPLFDPAFEIADLRKDQRIETPCPSCGHRTLFIGSGGHLTCSLIGCREPGTERAIAAKDARIAELESALAASKSAAPELRRLIALANEVVERDEELACYCDRLRELCDGPDADTQCAVCKNNELRDTITTLLDREGEQQDG